jgi:hypothetical protein
MMTREEIRAVYDQRPEAMVALVEQLYALIAHNRDTLRTPGAGQRSCIRRSANSPSIMYLSAYCKDTVDIGVRKDCTQSRLAVVSGPASTAGVGLD